MTNEKEWVLQKAFKNRDGIILCPICGESHGQDFLEITSIGIQKANSEYTVPFKWVYIYCNWADKGLKFIA